MKRILAIDDDVSILLLIKVILEKNIPGCDVDTAQSGMEGIKMANELKPDTILLDILMPGMNGFEVCKVLKNDNATMQIPVLLVSALGQNYENRIKGLNMGAEAFITKPFQNPELISQVKVLLRIKDAEDKLREKNEALKKNLKEIKKDREKLKKLNSELLMAEEKERRRIAEYLHDGIGPMLSLANINLSALQDKELMPAVQDRIHKASGLLNDAIIRSRSLTYDLSPPVLYELGLIPALKSKLNQIDSIHNINTGFRTNIPKINLNVETNILLYRIVCELLTNVIKHAEASFVEIQIEKDTDYYHFSVNDDGKGFHYRGKSTLVKKSGYGLFSINERLEPIQGHLDIDSKLKMGTKAIISIPVKNV